MNLLEALLLSKSISPQHNKVLVISCLETNSFEIYLKAFSKKFDFPVETISSQFGSLNISLLTFSQQNLPEQVIIILDWEDFMPGSSYRSNNTNLSTDLVEHINIETISQIENFILSQPNTLVTIIPPFMDVFPVTLEDNIYATRATASMNMVLQQLIKLQQKNKNVKLIIPSEALGDLAVNEWTDLSLLFKSGWPYSLAATERIAYATHQALSSKTIPKKILIADLDNTLWRGIIGDDGVDNISWERTEAAYKHLVFQRFLNVLTHNGILIGVCSKNDPQVAAAGLARNDLVVDTSMLVGSRVSWEPKSQMIRSLLQDLDLLPEAAVFVDDALFELEEVKANLPGVTTILFPKDNYELSGFIKKVSGHFKVSAATVEDNLRLNSYKARQKIQTEINETTDIEGYLQSLAMNAVFEYITDPKIERPLQLINKTNQFNLNGTRETQTSWRKFFTPDYRVIQCRLQDRLSDYGVILVAALRLDIPDLVIEHMVMSCRVFSRRLEYGFLQLLCDLAREFGCNQILFKHKKTDKNGPIQSFIHETCLHVATPQKYATPNCEDNFEWLALTTRNTLIFPGKLSYHLDKEGLSSLHH